MIRRHGLPWVSKVVRRIEKADGTFHESETTDIPWHALFEHPYVFFWPVKNQTKYTNMTIMSSAKAKGYRVKATLCTVQNMPGYLISYRGKVIK